MKKIQPKIFADVGLKAQNVGRCFQPFALVGKSAEKWFFALLILLFLVINTQVSFAQKRANVWYFGNKAGITFNTNPPTALTDGKLNTNEGCATICNENGQLLFYTV